MNSRWKITPSCPTDSARNSSAAGTKIRNITHRRARRPRGQSQAGPNLLFTSSRLSRHSQKAAYSPRRYEGGRYDLPAAKTESQSAARLCSCVYLAAVIGLCWLALLQSQDAAIFRLATGNFDSRF